MNLLSSFYGFIIVFICVACIGFIPSVLVVGIRQLLLVTSFFIATSSLLNPWQLSFTQQMIREELWPIHSSFCSVRLVQVTQATADP